MSISSFSRSFFQNINICMLCAETFVLQASNHSNSALDCIFGSKVLSSITQPNISFAYSTTGKVC